VNPGEGPEVGAFLLVSGPALYAGEREDDRPMVHLVLLQAPPHVLPQLRAASNGFFVLGEGQYVLGMEANSGAIRDWLRTLGAQHVAVLQLQGGWATFGRADLAEWLRGAAGIF
jgi:hypothetical protein